MQRGDNNLSTVRFWIDRERAVADVDNHELSHKAKFLIQGLCSHLRCGGIWRREGYCIRLHHPDWGNRVLRVNWKRDRGGLSLGNRLANTLPRKPVIVLVLC